MQIEYWCFLGLEISRICISEVSKSIGIRYRYVRQIGVLVLHNQKSNSVPTETHTFSSDNGSSENQIMKMASCKKSSFIYALSNLFLNPLVCIGDH